MTGYVASDGVCRARAGGAPEDPPHPLARVSCHHVPRHFALSSPLFTVLYNDAAAPDLMRGAVGAHPDPFGDAFGVHFLNGDSLWSWFAALRSP